MKVMVIVGGGEGDADDDDGDEGDADDDDGGVSGKGDAVTEIIVADDGASW